MQQSLRSFLEQLAVSQAVPTNTVAAYSADLRQFAAFVATHHPAVGDAPTTDAMRAFCEWLGAQGYAASTIARRVSALRAFGAYLVQTGAVASNPGDLLRPPRRARVAMAALTPEQVQALCAQPLGQPTPEGWRDCALLHALMATGLRASDLLALEVSDLSLAARSLRARQRHLSLPAAAVMALATYLAIGRPALLGVRPDNGALFLNRQGQRLTRQGCWGIVKGHARQVGLDEMTLERLRRGPY